MEKEHLHLLINEEIYRLPSDQIVEVSDGNESVAETVGDTEMVEKIEEKVSEVAEPQPEIVSETKSETKTEQVKPEIKEDSPHDSPHIPVHDLPESEPLPFAVFHTSHDPAENELLHKIIDACKIPADQYKVFSNGFDQAVKFKKALVFVPEAKAFYTPIPYKGSEFLCSKPLSHLTKDQNEKAKLWGALQKFVLQ